jgi:hypothetical protein
MAREVSDHNDSLLDRSNVAPHNLAFHSSCILGIMLGDDLKWLSCIAKGIPFVLEDIDQDTLGR